MNSASASAAPTVALPALTLYVDGACPLCAAEVRLLAGWNGAGRVAFVDIAAPGFDPAPVGFDLAALNRELHGVTADGAVLRGLDSTLAVYTLLGRGWMVWPLRVRALRRPLAALYRLFARNRYRVSARLGHRKPACDDGVCGVGKTFF